MNTSKSCRLGFLPQQNMFRGILRQFFIKRLPCLWMTVWERHSERSEESLQAQTVIANDWTVCNVVSVAIHKSTVLRTQKDFFWITTSLRCLGLFGISQKRGFAQPYGLGHFVTRRPTENPFLVMTCYTCSRGSFGRYTPSG